MSRRLLWVLIVCGLLCVGLEGASAWMLGHLATNRAVRDETLDAVHLVSAPGAPRPVLIVGNSLVLHGVDLDALQAALGPGYEAKKEYVLGSGYQDWRYGVPSLLDRGSRPSFIVLGFSPAQLVTDRPPVGRTARLVWTTGNLERYTVDERIGLTEASNLVLQHYSAFFALRDQLRQDSRKLIVPDYTAMAHDFFDRTPITPDSVSDVAIAALDSICAAKGVRFAYLLIPTRAPDDVVIEPMMIEAGKRAGVPVLIPVSNRALLPTDMLDGYHMNPTGAAAFSARTGAALRSISEAATRASASSTRYSRRDTPQ
jgi:hypothetical protein